MLYTIIINYNEKGMILTNNYSYKFTVELPYLLTNDNAKDIVYDKVPQELILNYYIVEDDLHTISIGDVVMLHVVKYFKYGSDTILADYCKVTEVSDTYIKIDKYDYKFDFSGQEITRKKKEIAHIKLLTQANLQSYNKENKCNELRNAITEKLDNGVLTLIDQIEYLETIDKILSIYN